MTTIDTDPDSQTVAAGWACSPLGQPDDEVGLEFADDARPDADTQSVTKHAILAGAVACGVGAGAAIALMFIDFTPGGSTVVVPGAETAPDHAVVVTETDPAPFFWPTTVAPGPVTAPAPAPQHAPEAVNTPSAPDVGTPPPAPVGPTVVVDVPLPPLPEPPADDQPPAPEDPSPEPPVLQNPDFKLPPPKPKPVPPVADVPDFTLPTPKPEPAPDLPLVPAPKP